MCPFLRGLQRGVFKTTIKGGVSVCLRLSTFACVCLRFCLCACLRSSTVVRVCLRLLAFAYAPLCCAPLCVTLIFETRVFAYIIRSLPPPSALPPHHRHGAVLQQRRKARARPLPCHQLYWSYPQCNWDFPEEIPEKFWEDSGKRSQSFSWTPPLRVRQGTFKPCNLRHLKPPGRFRSSLPLSTAGDAFFSFGKWFWRGPSELVMEFPVVPRAFQKLIVFWGPGYIFCFISHTSDLNRFNPQRPWGVALQVASSKVSRYKGCRSYTVACRATLGHLGRS